MARECCDCYYRISGGVYDECCEKHGRKHVDFDHPACSDFVPDDRPSCRECYYFEDGILGGKCKKKNKRIGNIVMMPPACSSFIQD